METVFLIQLTGSAEKRKQTVCELPGRPYSSYTEILKQPAFELLTIVADSVGSQSQYFGISKSTTK